MININQLDFMTVLTLAKYRLIEEHKIKFSKSCPSMYEIIGYIFKYSKKSYQYNTQQEIVKDYIKDKLEEYLNLSKDRKRRIRKINKHPLSENEL